MSNSGFDSIENRNNFSGPFEYPQDQSPEIQNGEALTTSISNLTHNDVKSINSDNLLCEARPKTNFWMTPKELYHREIGLYKNSAMWGTKFYQSLVAVQKLGLSKKLKENYRCVYSLDFNKGGDLIVSGSDDCKIYLWKWSEGKCMITYKSKHASKIFQTKFLTTQGDKFIVSSSRDGLVMLTARSNCDVIYSKQIARHFGACQKLGLHSDVPYVILSCGNDGFVKNIDVREESFEDSKKNDILCVKNNDETMMQIFGIDINPFNSSEFIISGDDGYVKMYDKRRISSEPLKKFGRLFHNSRQTSNNSGSYYSDRLLENILLTYSEQCSQKIYYPVYVTSAVYNYCGTEILVSYSKDDIYLFDVNGSSDNYIHSYSGHLNNELMKSANFYGPKSDYIVSGSDCGHMFIWNKKTKEIVQKIHADTRGSINVLEAHPNIVSLASSGFDKTIKIWEPVNEWKKPNPLSLMPEIASGWNNSQLPSINMLCYHNIKFNMRCVP